MWRSIILTIFLLITFVAVWIQLARPARTPELAVLYEGVVYERIVGEDPDVVVHVITVDLDAANASLVVTPPDANGRFPALTTSKFLRTFDLQIAINGSFYQETADPNYLQPLGLTISDGVTHIPPRSNWPALCVPGDAYPTFAGDGRCPDETQQALAGNVMLVENGVPLDPRSSRFPGRSNSFRPQPRTAVALDAAGATMWLVVADGRQPGYSDGLTLEEFARFVAGLGAYQALNLDGGGSSTLVAESWLGSRTLNSPVHNGIPTRQRAIPTHLGIAIRQ